MSGAEKDASKYLNQHKKNVLGWRKHMYITSQHKVSIKTSAA